VIGCEGHLQNDIDLSGRALNSTPTPRLTQKTFGL